MKRLFTLFAAALVVLAAASCEKREELQNATFGENSVTLTAFVTDDQTKTSFEKNGNYYYTYWSVGDEIAVIQNEKIYKFTLNQGAGTVSGTFEGNNVSGFDITQPFTAFYPYESVRLEGSNTKYTIAQEQHYGIISVPMAAYVEDYSKSNSLTFNHLLGLLKLTVKGAQDETLKSINIGAGAGVRALLSGEAKLKLNGNTPYLDTYSNNDHYPSNVTLNCINGQNLDGVAIGGDGESFWIALKSGFSLRDNLGVLIKTSKGSYYLPAASDSYTVQAGSILSYTVDLENNIPKSRAAMSVAYIDENGGNYGDGVLIGGTLWAPVNCGYKPKDGTNKGYPYGKLYQWGRKNGNGYDSTDETQYRINTAATPPSNPDNSYFYTKWNNVISAGENYYLWLSDSKFKFDYIPCPEGWELPSRYQMIALTIGYRSTFTQKDGQNGYWFSGNKEFDSNNTSLSVFLPAAGMITQDFASEERGTTGNYWTRFHGSGLCFGFLSFDKYGVAMNYNSWKCEPSNAYSVRCVKSKK